jgi:hypothetical protein
VTRHRRTAALLVAVLLCAARPAAAGGGGGGAPPRHAGLEFDARALGDDAAAVERKVRDHVVQVLYAEQVVAGRAGQDPVLRVVVERSAEGSTGFRVTGEVVTAAGATAWSHPPSVCELCTEAELAARAGDVVRELTRHLPDPADDRAAQPSGESGAASPQGDPPTTTQAKPSRRLGPGGATGIALLSVGGAAFATGIALAVLPPRDVPDDSQSLRQTSTPGYAVLAVGAALAITGATLLAVALRKRKVTGTSTAHPHLTHGLLLRF